MSASAIIVAAGAGRRIGGDTPKVFMPLCGRPMILRTVDRFLAARAIDEVVVVVAADHLARAQSLLESDVALRGGAWKLQSGGSTRQESVRRGLQMIGADVDVIAIHDGARPFVSPALIACSVQAARASGAVVVGLPARDTIKSVTADRWVESTPVRGSLWEVQTPQVFKRAIIFAAYEWAAHAGFEATDDAMLVEKHGEKVLVLEGERSNLKITFADDVWLAETMIEQGRIA